MAQAGALDAGAREQQHVERQVDAKPALEPGAEHFHDAACAGAEIEQRAERPVAERIANGLLDRFVRHVELADAVPFGGVRPEVVLCRGGPRGTDRGQPVAIAGDDRVLRTSCLWLCEWSADTAGIPATINFKPVHTYEAATNVDDIEMLTASVAGWVA